MSRPPFHLAFAVSDLEQARDFYAGVLGCRTGRESARWIDFDFWGHQLVAHLVENETARIACNEVDGEAVPATHFGPVLDWQEFHDLVDRLRAADIEFVIEPQIRFAGTVGEQATMFIRDPSGNHLEFKSFRDPAQLFATDQSAW